MSLSKINNIFQNYRKSKFVQYGLPFILLTFIGSYGLKESTEIRYKYRKNRDYIKEMCDESGIDIKPRGSVTLESEFEKIKNVDIDNWENKRVPRPWNEEE